MKLFAHAVPAATANNREAVGLHIRLYRMEMCIRDRYGTVLAVFTMQHRKYHVDPLPDNAVAFKAQQALTAYRRQGGTAVLRAVQPGPCRQHAVIRASEQHPVAVPGDPNEMCIRDRMKALSGSDEASDEMCRFVVMNTASIQLIPTTVAAVRAAAGARSPFDILPAVWVTSLCSVAVGLAAAFALQRLWRAGQ